MEILAQIQGITVKPRPVATNASTRQMRLVADDKSELDKMIEAELQRGWTLVSRSYNLDDGHGALLYWNDMSKAA